MLYAGIDSGVRFLHFLFCNFCRTFGIEDQISRRK
jgi:hypothetical protein